MKKFFWFALLLLLILTFGEVLRVYFIMPFPGSQEEDAVALAYILHNNIWIFRIVFWALLVFCTIKVFYLKPWAKIIVGVFFIIYGSAYYMFNYKFLADKMFYQPETKIVVGVANNKIPADAVVLGIQINGEAKAYPLEIIGYHHQVIDTLAGQPIMVTYCTVCRTGRIYSPVLNGEKQEFRLVGMDNFNAMFEDKKTGSWWRQVNGEAVAGEMKGKRLTELPSEQTTLESWMEQHPNSLVLQPDPKFVKNYKDLEGYGRGILREKDNKLEGVDTTSWGRKSLVVGVSVAGVARAYDWNQLVKKRVINDTLNQTPIVLVLEADGQTFHTYNSRVGASEIEFILSDDGKNMYDSNRLSVWNMAGHCTVGAMLGMKLQPLQCYQEFWHSWQTFHPNTTKH